VDLLINSGMDIEKCKQVANEVMETKTVEMMQTIKLTTTCKQPPEKDHFRKLLEAQVACNKDKNENYYGTRAAGQAATILCVVAPSQYNFSDVKDAIIKLDLTSQFLVDLPLLQAFRTHAVGISFKAGAVEVLESRKAEQEQGQKLDEVAAGVTALWPGGDDIDDFCGENVSSLQIATGLSAKLQTISGVVSADKKLKDSQLQQTVSQLEDALFTKAKKATGATFTRNLEHAILGAVKANEAGVTGMDDVLQVLAALEPQYEELASAFPKLKVKAGQYQLVAGQVRCILEWCLRKSVDPAAQWHVPESSSVDAFKRFGAGCLTPFGVAEGIQKQLTDTFMTDFQTMLMGKAWECFYASSWGLPTVEFHRKRWDLKSHRGKSYSTVGFQIQKNPNRFL